MNPYEPPQSEIQPDPEHTTAKKIEVQSPVWPLSVLGTAILVRLAFNADFDWRQASFGGLCLATGAILWWRRKH